MSPPLSCKQWKASSWLVPPPLSTLEQAMCIKSSTRKNKYHLNQWGQSNKSGREQAERLDEINLLLSWSPGLSLDSSTGSQTRSALCWSDWEESWSCNSGISAWYFSPILIRLIEGEGKIMLLFFLGRNLKKRSLFGFVHLRFQANRRSIIYHWKNWRGDFWTCWKYTRKKSL